MTTYTYLPNDDLQRMVKKASELGRVLKNLRHIDSAFPPVAKKIDGHILLASSLLKQMEKTNVEITELLENIVNEYTPS